MAVDERARHQLFLRMEEELGPEAAQTMMELLPPVGWADVATKEDLRRLEERMDLRFEALETTLRSEFQLTFQSIRTEMQAMRGDFLQTLVHEMHTLFRNVVVLCASLVASVAGLAFAAARLS